MIMVDESTQMDVCISNVLVGSDWALVDVSRGRMYGELDIYTIFSLQLFWFLFHFHSITMMPCISFILVYFQFEVYTPY